MVKDYVIETTGISSVPMGGFIPRKRVAFIIQGVGNLFHSFNMMADCIVQRGYNDIVAVRDAPHLFCRERRSLHKANIVGLLEDLAKELTPDDVLFTAVLGASYTKTGTVYLPIPRSSSEISAVELRDLISRIPVHHVVHYVSPDIHAGEFARYLGQASHPDLGNRHIAIAPTVPNMYQSSSFYTVSTGEYRPAEVVTPFHAGFFSMNDQPSLEARFRTAAHYQRKFRRDALAYMHYGAVHPSKIAFRLAPPKH